MLKYFDLDTSAASGIGLNVYPAHDKTPSPTTTNLVPQPLISPVSNMSVASMVSPASPGGHRYDRPQSLESGSLANIGRESRRESVDSRMNQNFGDMKIGSSPYASQNQSTTSIQGTLAQQRNPRAGIDQLSTHRISNGYQPNVERTPEGHHSKTIRTAPAITGPATSNIARAAEPTKGQAWAFPEEEIQRVPSATGNHSFYDSRRSSVAESIASSQFTSESRLPPGQRRLDEGLGEYQRMSNVSGDFPQVHVHHHTLQHKQLSDLQSEESSPPNGAQPYSRTPELRVSHKLAERRRRTEMKELFEQLRDLMPQERGSKASKWEILTKGKNNVHVILSAQILTCCSAITEHQRQQEAIKQLSSHYQSSIQEAELLRRELERMRGENAQLRNGVPVPPSQSQTSHASSSQAAAESYSQDPYGRQQPQRPELPPLRSLSGNLPNGPDSMTGVQYDDRPNGFRQDRY